MPTHSRIRSALLNCAFGISVLAIAGSAYAADDSSGGPFGGIFGSYTNSDPLDDQYMTGGWDGYRSKLVNAGVDFRVDYTSETMGVASGGMSRGARYSQQFRINADFDMAKIAGWSDGRFHLQLNDRRGNGTSTDLAGNRFPIQENYGQQWTKITEMSFDQNLFNGRVNYRIGYLPFGNTYAMNPMMGNFVNAALAFHPLSYAGNTSWSNYPNPRWAGFVTAYVLPDLYIRAGVSQANSNLNKVSNAFDPFASGTTGAVVPVEIGYEPGKGTAYPGHYKVGFFYDSSNVKKQGSTDTVGHRDGAYFMFDQKITTVGGNDNRGLSLFGHYMWSSPETAVLRHWASAGFVYTGLFASRPKDTLAFGYVQSSVNKQLLENARLKADATPGSFDAFTTAESLFEVSYNYQINNWASIRPDVQYITDPGSFYFKHIANTLAVGAQVKIAI